MNEILETPYHRWKALFEGKTIAIFADELYERAPSEASWNINRFNDSTTEELETMSKIINQDWREWRIVEKPKA